MLIGMNETRSLWTFKAIKERREKSKLGMMIGKEKEDWEITADIVQM